MSQRVIKSFFQTSSSASAPFLISKDQLSAAFVCNHNIFIDNGSRQFHRTFHDFRPPSTGWKSPCFRFENLIFVQHENQSCIFKEFKISIRERLCLWKLNLCYSASVKCYSAEALLLLRSSSPARLCRRCSFNNVKLVRYYFVFRLQSAIK